ncbi:MAG: ABC transporter substrate-binding protein [Candidatus Eisenbacteria bacterium]
MRRSAVRSIGLLFALALSLVLHACGREGVDTEVDTENPATEAITTPWLRVVVPVPPSVDPLEGRRPFRLELWRYLYPALLRLEPESPAAMGASGGPIRALPKARPDLARAWRWDPEDRSLLLSLDPRRRWSTGEPISAGDVVRSYRFLEERNLLPTRPGPRGSGQGAAGRVAADQARRDPRGRDRILRAIDVMGDSLVVLRFVPGVPEWLATEVATAPVLPQVKIDLTTGALKPEPGVPTPVPPRGAPFRLEPVTRSDQLRLVARKDAEGAAEPKIEGILTDVLPGDPGRIERVLRGDADVALDVSADGVARRTRDDGSVALYAGAIGSIEMLCWNVALPGLPSELRRATDLVIDRGRIGRLFAIGDETYASPGGGFFTDRDSVLVPDILAASLELGYPTPLPPGAPPRRFLNMIYDRNNQVREQIATYLEEDLARIGVALRPIPLEGPEVWRRYLAGDFEVALLGFQPPLSLDLSGLYASWGSWNGMGYQSAVADSLIRETYRSDGDDVVRLARLLEQQVRRDQAVTYLVRRQRIDLLRSRVEGFDGTPWLPLGKAWNTRLRRQPAAPSGT